MNCDICGKDYKNLGAHKRMAHPDTKDITVTREAIAKLIYDEVVRPLCDNHSIQLMPWNGVEQSKYYEVADKILEAING